MLQMGADPVAALVVAETGDEEDRMVETREPDRDIRGGAADMLDGTFTVPGDDVDEGFTDHEKLRIHPFRALRQVMSLSPRTLSPRLLSEQQLWYAIGAGTALLAFVIGRLSAGGRNKRRSEWV